MIRIVRKGHRIVLDLPNFPLPRLNPQSLSQRIIPLLNHTTFRTFDHPLAIPFLLRIARSTFRLLFEIPAGAGDFDGEGAGKVGWTGRRGVAIEWTGMGTDSEGFEADLGTGVAGVGWRMTGRLAAMESAS